MRKIQSQSIVQDSRKLKRSREIRRLSQKSMDRYTSGISLSAHSTKLGLTQKLY